MVTDSYYQNEDAPDMSNPETAMAMFEQQAAAIANVGEVADQTLEDIGKKLGATLKFAEEKGLDKLAERTQLAWQHAQTLNRQVHHLASASKGAAAAIGALKKQRDAVAAEHLNLVNAINNGDEDHPQLAGYAEGIRNDAYELMQEDMEEGALDYAFEVVSDHLASNILEIFGVDWATAQKISLMLQGEDGEPTDEQRAAFLAFAATVSGGQAES